MSINTLKRLITIKYIRSVVMGLCVGLFCSALCLFAPSASAEDFDDLFSDVCNHYDLDEDTCYWIGTAYYTGGSNKRVISVYPVGSDAMLYLRSGTFGNSRGIQWQFANGYSYSEATQTYATNGTAMYAGVYGGYDDFLLPFPFYGTYPVDDIIMSWYGNQNDLNLTFDEAVDYNQLSNPLINSKFTNPDTMLTGYLDEHGYAPSSAYLADSNYVKIEELNIVTNLNDLDIEYSGMYCLRKEYDKILTFEVARTPDYIPTQTQLNAYLIVEFDVPANTEWSSYFGYSYSDSPHPIAYAVNSSPFTSFDRAYPMGIPPLAFYGVEVSGSSAEPTSDMTIKYAIQWYNMNLASIPRPQSSPIYISFNYTLTENGTITGGKGSTSYEDYETTYIQNNYNIAIGGLTGTITGSTSFSADWSGADLTTDDIDYNDTFRFDDTQVTSFFTRIFTAGDGFLTTAVLGVLSIAFAAYILFGKH